MAPTQQETNQSCDLNNSTSNSSISSRATATSVAQQSVQSTSSSISKNSSSTSNSSNIASIINSLGSKDLLSDRIGSNSIHESSSCSSINSSNSSNKDTGNKNILGNSITLQDKSRTSSEWPISEPYWEQDCLLPIATRGLFLGDSFFQDAREDFEKAVQEVLNKWGQNSGSKDDLASYRMLRECDLKDSNQAVSVTQSETEHKVVLDVKDFMKGDVKVKMIDENELVAEGSVEIQEGCAVSKKSFKRSFTFPGLIKAEKVSSAMSSDGVLTIRIPKDNRAAPSVQGPSSVNNSFLVNNKTESIASEYKNNQSNGRKESVKVSESKKTQSSNTSKSNSENSAPFASSNNNKESAASGNKQTKPSDTPINLALPIITKGQFLEDSFFKSAREDFEKSVQDSLNKWGKAFSEDFEENLASYRILREGDLEPVAEATSVTETETYHKVVLDVKDYTSKDISVKVVDENELKVEGKVEKEKDGASSSKSFSRSFTFPGLINPEAVTSAISSDGILTITIPKDKQQSKTLEILSDTKVTNLNNQKKSGGAIPKEKSQSKTCNTLSESKITDLNNTKTETANKVTFDAKSQNEKKSETHVIDKNDQSEWLLPVFEKGLFYHDDFFASAREEFERSVKKVLERFEKTSSASLDDMESYRTLRKEDLREENQAASLSEDHQCHKVVMDVKDFKESDLQVKIVDENELVVEGSAEMEDKGSVSKRSFHRRFVFPTPVKPEDVASTMSSDGVLVVTVPKKNQENDPKFMDSLTEEDLESNMKNSKQSVEQHSERFSSSNASNSIQNYPNIAKSLAEKNLETNLKSSSQSSERFSKCFSSNNSVSSVQSAKQNVLSESDLVHRNHDSDLMHTPGTPMENEFHDLSMSHMMSSIQDDFFARAQREFESVAKNVFGHFSELETRGEI